MGKVRFCRGCQHARWLFASAAGLSEAARLQLWWGASRDPCAAYSTRLVARQASRWLYEQAGDHHCGHGDHAWNFSEPLWFVLSGRRIGWSRTFVYHLRIRFWPPGFFQHTYRSSDRSFGSRHSCRSDSSIAARR